MSEQINTHTFTTLWLPKEHTDAIMVMLFPEIDDVKSCECKAFKAAFISSVLSPA